MTSFTIDEIERRLSRDLEALDLLSNPVWVFDPARNRKLYANSSAVALWGAEDLASLRSRDFSAKSDAARIRTEQTLLAVMEGELKTDVWTFYPNGDPVSVRTVASGLLLPDGSTALLFEASVAEEPAELVRALAALRHAQIIVSIYDKDGLETFGNPHAVQMYGGRRLFSQRCEMAEEAVAAWATALETGRFRGRLSMLTDLGATLHDVTLQRTIDPVTGETSMLCYESDDSDKVRFEADLARHAHDLDEARRRAEEANEAKSVFLANMSHELRTPLNGVVSLADLLCRSELTPPEREAAELIRTSGRSLEQLLAGILQLAEIEAGGVSLNPRPFDPASVIHEVTYLLQVKAEENGTALNLHIDLPGGHVRWGDPLRFRQIVTNLISNAVKFTRDGSVQVTLQERDQRVRLLVKDSGVGFTEEQKARIFDRFQQADGSITRRFGGSGLGLAIVDELVDRMGGEIGCDSTLGAGSCFWVDLPMAVTTVSAVAEPELQNTNDFGELQVLVADDHPINRRVLEMILRPLGAEVASVENGAEAVAATRHASFDVVLMDMQMPVMDGLAATKAIVLAGGPPVIMVSANGMPEHVEAALNAGAVAHLIKPIEPAALAASIIAAVAAAKPPQLRTGRAAAESA